MINVKMVIGQFRPINGGAERQAELLATILIKKSINVEVYTGRPFGVPAHLPDDPVPVRRLWVPGFGLVKMMMLIPAFYLALLSSRQEIEIIHVHQALYPAFAAVLAAQRLGVPSIVKCANSGPRFDLAMLERGFPLGRSMAQSIARHATCFIALNEQIGAQLAEWGVEASRIVHIPNGVVVGEAITVTEKQESRKRLGLQQEDYVVVSVGSLHPKKDFSTLLRALAKCRKAIDPTLLLAGDGPLSSQLRDEARELGIAPRVHFSGSVPGADVRNYLAAADVFVLSSVAEGVSNALLEAMAAGLPCVVTNIPGNRLLVEHGETGLLFGVGDAESLAEAIELIGNSSEFGLALSKKARQKVVSAFKIEQVADQYIELYERLLKSGS